jgi:homoserine O-succinyltransferase
MGDKKLSIAVLNLMPSKQATENHFQSILKEAGAECDLTWLTTYSYKSKNVSEEYLALKYTDIRYIEHERFDVFIITGAPLAKMDFEEVSYWEELKMILHFTRTNSLFNIFVCWAAQAALYHFYGVNRVFLAKKCFGVFEQRINPCSLFYQDAEHVLMPHSRHTSIDKEAIERSSQLFIDACCGQDVSVISSKDGKDLFITGHPEYDFDTLDLEYRRDLSAKAEISKPLNYYPNNDVNQIPSNTWRPASLTLYRNIIKHVLNLKEKREQDAKF